MSQLNINGDGRRVLLCRPSKWKVSALAAVFLFTCIVVLVEVGVLAALGASALATPLVALFARSAICLDPEGGGDQVRLIVRFRPAELEPRATVMEGMLPFMTATTVTFRRPDGKVRGVSLDFMRSDDRKALIEELARRAERHG